MYMTPRCSPIIFPSEGVRNASHNGDFVHRVSTHSLPKKGTCAESDEKDSVENSDRPSGVYKFSYIVVLLPGV